MAWKTWTKALGPRADLWLGLALFALTLSVYVRTLCPTIYWGDCGEMAAAVYTLGITHPTGYPLWTLLGKVWTVIFPFGTFIWRLNLLSAIFGALAASALFGFGRRIGLSRPTAFAMAGLYAFTHTLWQQSLFAETYSLTACYTCTILYLAARWRDGGRRAGDLRRLALVCGLAMTNGQINTLFLPGVALFVLWSAPELRGLRGKGVRRQWLQTVGVGVIPLLCYLYLPLSVRMHPAAAWGDPSTPAGFLYHVTGQPYTFMMFHTPLPYVLRNLGQWATGLGGEYPWALLPAALWGLWALWRGSGSRPLAALLTWVVVADVFYAINYAIYNRYIYFLPSYAALAALAGAGLTDLWPRLEARAEQAKRPALRTLGAASLLLLLVPQIVGHWRKNDLHDNWTCEDYGRNLLASVPPGGLLVDNGSDECNSALLFEQHVRGLRPDVLSVNRGFLLLLYDFDHHWWANLWYWRRLEAAYPPARDLYPQGKMTIREVAHEEMMHRLIAQAVGAGRPVCVIRAARWPDTTDEWGRHLRVEDYLTEHYDTAPVGLETRVYPRGRRPSDRTLLAQTQAAWSQFSLRGVYDGLYLGDGFLTPIAIDYADAGLARARLADAGGDYAEAAAAYGGVLHLFRSDEASVGLARCAQTLQRGQVASARP